MADPRLVDYIRQNAPSFGAEVLRRHLLGQGVPEVELDAAMGEALPTMPPLVVVPSPPPPGAVPPTVPGRRRRAPRAAIAVGALVGGLALMGVSYFMGRPAATPPVSTPAAATDASLFHGTNDFILKLPPGYAATDTFSDAERTVEVVYVYPQGMDPQNFIDEGLYDQLGILKLEVMPRRVPQGFIGMDTLKAWVTSGLKRDESVFESKSTIVNGMPALIIKVSKPFQSRKAYLVGEKVRYTLVGGYENPVFDEVLETLAETSGRGSAED